MNKETIWRLVERAISLSVIFSLGIALIVTTTRYRVITEQLQNARGNGDNTTNLGFNPEEQKWYGWSHRAIFGFGIGSECKEGNCAFMPGTKEEFRLACLRFWGDTDMEDTNKKEAFASEVSKGGKLGVYVGYTYDSKVPNEELRGTVSGVFSEYPETWGKGEWTTTTLEEAKEMAIDFASSVS